VGVDISPVRSAKNVYRLVQQTIQHHGNETLRDDPVRMNNIDIVLFDKLVCRHELGGQEGRDEQQFDRIAFEIGYDAAVICQRFKCRGGVSESPDCQFAALFCDTAASSVRGKYIDIRFIS